jgi:hypothetical protein
MGQNQYFSRYVIVNYNYFLLKEYGNIFGWRAGRT